VEISAEQLVYDRRRSLLTYDGGVSARQAARSLRCITMDVELGPDGKAERLTCRAEVQVQDSSTGRTVEGDVAVWEPAAETVRVSGERVRMRDRDGALIEGPILIYDFASGQARIESPRPLPPPPAAPGA
jgi:lipopolysaccharide export system protein LptA